MLYMALGVFYSANPFNSVSTLSMWVIMFLIYVSMTTVLCNKHRLDTALFSISLWRASSVLSPASSTA